MVTSEFDYDPNRVAQARDRFFAISGCSGSGKSTLLSELGRRGYGTVAEPGRQIVKEQLSIGGDALPWADAEKFVEQVISRAIHQMIVATRFDGAVFFDRGIVDAVTALERMQAPISPQHRRALQIYGHNRKAFLSPPWPEIYRIDAERQHSFENAVGEYIALEEAYPRHGYETILLPKCDVAARADFVLSIVEG